MRVNLIYCSKYGNGGKAMKKVREHLSQAGHECLCLAVKDANPKELPPADLYVVSAPTQFGGVPGKMKRFINKMDVPRGAKFGAIVTHVSGEPALDKMAALLESKGLVRAAETDLKVAAKEGPLEPGWQEKVKAFARELG